MKPQPITIKRPDPETGEIPDRVLALRAMMEAKGSALPEPPRCHGYANCCRCPVCLRREQRGHGERLAA